MSSSLLALVRPQLAGLTVVLIGLLGLSGWLADIPALRTPTPTADLPVMSVNSSLSMLLCGLALLLCPDDRAPPWRLWASSLLLLPVLGFALLTSFEYVGNGDFPLLHLPRQLLGLDNARALSSPYGAPSFVLLAAGLLLQLHVRHRWLRNLAQGLMVLVVGLSLVVLLGYLSGQGDRLGTGSSNGTALYSAVAFLLLSAGLFNRDLQAWPARQWYGAGTGSRLLRKLAFPLAALLLLFFLLGLGGVALVPLAAHALLFILGLGLCWWGLALVCDQLNREQVERRQIDLQFAELFEGNPDGLVVVNARGLISRVNARIEELTGFSRDELQDQSLCRLLPAGTSLGEDGGSGLEAGLHTHDGGEIPVSIAFHAAVLEGQLCNILSIRDLRAYKQLLEDLRRMRHAAGHDNLTGLLNRNLLGELLDNALARAERHGQLVAVCFCDLDGFKAINDTHGHPAGDQLLVEVAHRIRSCVRHHDLVARPGGDEFIVVLTDLDDAAPIERVAGQISQLLASPYRIGGLELRVSVSIGICLYPQYGSTASELLQHADQALYAAKHAGKNCIRHYPPELSRQRDQLHGGQD